MQDGETLVGTLSGPPNKKTAYYRHRRSKRGRLKGSVFNNLIPAKPLHEAIVALLAEVLVDTPDLEARLTRHLQDQQSKAAEDQPDVVQLEAEREQLKQQITLTVRSLSGAALEDAQDELKRLGDRRNAIEAMLVEVRNGQKLEMRPAETVVAEALETLSEESQRLLTLPIQPLRNLVNHLIADATVDMETKAVELKLNVPAWILQPKTKKKGSKQKKGETVVLEGTEALCPATNQRSPASCQTHPDFTIDLGAASCRYVLMQRGVCFQCQRIPQAA